MTQPTAPPRILVLGSSHTVALKEGHARLPEELRAALDVTFFALGGSLISHYTVDAVGHFRLRDDVAPALASQCREQARAINDGTEEVDLAPFDVICLAGTFNGLDPMIRLLPQVGVGGMHDPDTAAARGTLLSPEALEGIAARMIDRAIPAWDFTALAGKRLFVMSPPLPFEKVLRPEVGGRLGAQITEEIRANPAYVPCIQAYLADLTEALQARAGMTLLPQPPETLSAHGILSADSYADGAKRIGGGDQPDRDFLHGNARWGELFWTRFAPLCAAA